MKKEVKKIIARIVAIVSMTSLVISTVGCAGIGRAKKQSINSEEEIEISYWNAGLGREWLDAVIAAFEEEHPEYKVVCSATADMTSTTAAAGMEDIDTVDLYMTYKTNDLSYLEPLTEVLESKSYGDSMTVEEKMKDGYLKYERAQDGNVYTLTYGGGITGFVYNKKIFEQAGIKELPRTSNELAYVCDELANAGYTPLIHYSGNGYYYYIFNAWQSQYDGSDYYVNTFYGNPTLDTLTKKDGRYQALKALEKFVTPEYVYAGSNSQDHTTAQTTFLTDGAAIMVNGSWLSNEMKETGSLDGFAMMKLPVLSAVMDKLDSVNDETVLRKLVTAIDCVTDGTKNLSDYVSGEGYDIEGTKVSKADWEYVENCRNMMGNNYVDESCFIPSYANAKEGAKEFLKFLYSDKGYKIYCETLHIGLPMTTCTDSVDTSGWNNFEKQQYDLLFSTKDFLSAKIMSEADLFLKGGASADGGFQYIPPLCTKNPADKLNAEQIWANMIDNIADKYETQWLENIK